MLLQTLQRVAGDLRTALGDLDPERLSGTDAARLLEVFADIEKLAAAGTLLTARRVESSKVWKKKGHRSAAAHVAEATGTALGPAINSLEAARQLRSLPTAEGALREGRLSGAQVKEIAGAATVRPEAEQELVDAAGKQPLNVLKIRCRRVKAEGEDQRARYEAIRRARYLRHWIDNDGSVRFDAKLTPDEGARLVNAVKAETDRLATEARRAGHDEPRRAFAADALVNLACGPREGEGAPVGPEARPGRSGGGPTTMVHVRVDHAALVRGWVEGGEVCEIPGIGPIPVEVARALAADSILSVLVSRGVDVTAVAHVGRTIPAAVRRALLERDERCVVPGCGVREPLEIDHIDPYGQGGPTELANLCRLCHFHHYLKTHQRHRLERVGDAWTWTPPGSSGDPPGPDRPS